MVHDVWSECTDGVMTVDEGLDFKNILFINMGGKYDHRPVIIIVDYDEHFPNLPTSMGTKHLLKT